MIGHGSPATSGQCFASVAPGTTSWGCRFLLAIALTFWARGAIVGEETLRLRIDWGGRTEKVWQGVIAVSEGTLSELHPLGIEADEPGSMWLDRGPVFAAAAGDQPESSPPGPQMDQLVIRQPSPRTYDGADLLVTAPLEAKLLIALWTQQSRAEPRWITIPLKELLDEPHLADLDDQGSQLAARRAPGDKLRVTLKRRSLVFSPGETLAFEVQPHLLSTEPGTELRLKIELMPGRGTRGRTIQEQSFVAGDATPIPQEIQLPDEEGVYDLLLTVRPAGRRLLSPPIPVRRQKPLAERRVQVLVLGPQPPVAPQGPDSQLSPVKEIDPANPKWWDEHFTDWWEEHFAKLPRPRRFALLRKGPLGNGRSQTWEHPLGQVMQLGPSLDTADVPWQAYTLPIQEPGRPHVLEVDYPSDVPQTMGISIIEPNAAGAMYPLGLDSGVTLSEEVTGLAHEVRWLSHRVIFWPKTKSPIVLITNRQADRAAVYGKIRVRAFGEHLPPFPARGNPPERLLAAYLDRPLLPECFSATQPLLPSGKQSVDDWITFYEAGTRLVEYLDHVGYGGLMLSVLADGSTIYESAVLEPTPRYDTGVFQGAGQDPVRKDVLEMLFRLFDRRHLKLIPAMEFSTPLPELEAVLRRGGPAAEGLRWVGPEGKHWVETYRPVRGMAPYYNVLHPRVQEAMLAAIREIVSRYGDHPSFAGLAIQLSAYGYAQLPLPNWGMDDATIARFEQDTEIRVPGEGQERFAERATYLATKCPGQWTRWRAAQLRRFYGRVQAELAAVRPEGRLYLAGANMLNSEQLERELRPALPREMAITEAMLRVGIDIRDYGADPGIILLRPERIAPQWSLVRQAVSLEIRQMLQIEQTHDGKLPFEGMSIPGSLFFHEPQEVRVASFDEKSPFQPCYTWLATQPVPAAWQNRRRFVHSLAALDSHVMFDGGRELPFGQEDSIRHLVAAYRQLPAIRFQRLSDQFGSDPAQPVAIRYATYQGSTYVYLVNDAPFATRARIDVDCPSTCQVEELSGLREVSPLRREAGGTYWTVELEPYDLLAVRFSSPRVTLLRPQVHWLPEIQAKLKAQIDDLKDRAATLAHSPPILRVLENPGFESPATADGRIPGWGTSLEAGSAIELDSAQKHAGTQAVRIVSRGAAAGLISRPFEPPSTGRLTMAVWVRGADAAPGPRLLYVLEGTWRGAPFVRWQTRQVAAEWQPFVVEAKDLPLEGLSSLRIRFDLIGPGEIWIDDVQLSALVFNQVERNALLKLIAPADLKLERGQVRDCIRLLEGYWPRFLLAHVPATASPLARDPEPRPRLSREPEKPPGFLGRMRGFVPRPLRSFF